MRRASSRTWATNASCGNTRFTRPTRAASSADSRSGRKKSSFALAGPTRRVSCQVVPKSPPKPTLANAVPNRARSEAKQRSHDSAIPSPAPTAGPLTAAIVTLGMSDRSHGSSCISRWRSTCPSNVLPAAAPPIAETSPPAQKARPAPVSRTAPTSGSVAQRRRWAMAASIIASESAFSLAGRFIVRIATRSSMANWRSSVSMAMRPPEWPVTLSTSRSGGPSARQGPGAALAEIVGSMSLQPNRSDGRLRSGKEPTMRIAILLYDGMTALDAIGPYDVLRQLPGAEVVFVGDTAGVKRTEQQPLGLVADRALGEVTKADILVVPGGFGQERVMREARTLEWIRSIHATTEWTTSVCTGSLILGAAGLLRGLRATTHWASLERLRELGAEPVAERVVEQGKIITAAGVSAGIDMALRLVARVVGDDLARGIQLGIEYDPAPPFDTGSPSKAPAHVVQLVRQALELRRAQYAASGA